MADPYLNAAGTWAEHTRRKGRLVMGIISWVILGLIAGWIGSKLFHGSGQGFLLNVALGIIGAVIGGYLFTLFGATGVTGLNIWSLIVATIGALVVQWVYFKLFAK
jgi:uncharacterized membrane protein YeaQ/YmgE (transglycosylase-associated protein family)